MKKFIIILIIVISFIPFITKKNDYKDITTVNYISSIGIDYNLENHEFTIYSYIINNLNVASNSSSPGNSELKSYVIKNSNKNFSEAFLHIKKQTNINIYYTHLETIILSYNFLNKNNIEEFFYFIKDSIEIYPTFYLFTTNSNLDDIYNIEYLTDISSYHTLLVNPTLSKSHQFVTFLDFAKLYLTKKYTLLIPHIVNINDILLNKDNQTNLLEIDGYTSISPNLSLYNLIESEFSFFKWLRDFNKQYIAINNNTIYIKQSKYSVKKKNNIIYINYNISSIITKNNNNIEYIKLEQEFSDFIKKEIINLLTKTISLDIDSYNLKYLYNIDKLDLNKIQVTIKLKTN